LTGDDRGRPVVAIVEDFQKVALGLVGERRDRKVVDQQQVSLGE